MLTGNGSTTSPKGLLMRKNMTPADLRTGMVLVLANKEKYLIFGDRLVSEYGFLCLESYTETLEHYDKSVLDDINKEYNIDEVYDNNTELSQVGEILEVKPENLIWKRADNKEILEQIHKLENELQSLKEMVR